MAQRMFEFELTLLQNFTKNTINHLKTSSIATLKFLRRNDHSALTSEPISEMTLG